MSRRIAFICYGKSKNFINKGWDNLNSLVNNVQKVSDYLQKHGNWEIEPFSLQNNDTISNKLSTLKNNNVTEVLLYYTGHGGTSDNKYCLVGEDNEEILLDNILHPIRRSENHINFAVIIDACQSGKILKDVVPKENIDFLTSTSSLLQEEKEFDGKWMSVFSYHFCECIRNNIDKNLSLNNIVQYFDDNQLINNPQNLKLSTKFSKTITITYPIQQDKLKELKQDLKVRISDVDKLKRYVTNLLPFDNIDLPDDFDDIVDHLYKHSEVFLCFLKQLSGNNIEIHFKKFQREFNCSDEKLEQLSYMKIDMEQQRENFLIELSPNNGDKTLTDVNIWIDAKPYPTSKYQNTIDLTDDKEVKNFVDDILKQINTSRDEVFLEFIIPFELFDVDFLNWESTDGDIILGETYIIVRRLKERMEKSRTNDTSLKEWRKFWKYYKAKAEITLPNCRKIIQNNNYKDIVFRHFKNTPYLRLDNVLNSENIYNRLLRQVACIVLAPTKNDNNNPYSNEKEKAKKLKELVEISLETFEEEVPYLLVWDNPNRIIYRYKNQDKSLKQG